jgi:uncharacterized protein YybS (DUF2232 family)
MHFRPIIIAALQAAGLTIAGFLVPMLGQVAVIFVPVPLLLVTVLHGRRAGALSVALAAGIVSVAGGFHATVVLFFLSFGLMALVLAEGLVKGAKPESVAAVAGILPLFVLLLVVAPALLKTGKDPMTLGEELLRRNIADVRRLYTDLGAAEVVEALDALSDRVVFYVVRLLPGMVLVTTVLQAAACYGIGRTLALRRIPGLAAARQPTFDRWHAPDAWVWPLIATLALVALAPRDSAAWFLGLNLSLLWLLVYAAQGAALLEHFLRKARMTVIARSFLQAVILLLPTAVAVIAFGVVDIWADFRKVRTPQA